MWLVVINPTSGGGRGRKLGAEVVAKVRDRNLEFVEIIENSAQATSDAIARALKNYPVTGVMVVGGDGLVHLDRKSTRLNSSH